MIQTNVHLDYNLNGKLVVYEQIMDIYNMLNIQNHDERQNT